MSRLNNGSFFFIVIKLSITVVKVVSYNLDMEQVIIEYLFLKYNINEDDAKKIYNDMLNKKDIEGDLKSLIEYIIEFEK